MVAAGGRHKPDHLWQSSLVWGVDPPGARVAPCQIPRVERPSARLRGDGFLGVRPLKTLHFPLLTMNEDQGLRLMAVPATRGR
jgi:hypothetical protein